MVELIDGTVIALTGVLVGRFLPARRKRSGLKDVKPVCGCGHHQSFHDPNTGGCHSMMRVPNSMSRDSYYTTCTCRQYSGPEPLPEVYAPEITGR